MQMQGSNVSAAAGGDSEWPRSRSCRLMRANSSSDSMTIGIRSGPDAGVRAGREEGVMYATRVMIRASLAAVAGVFLCLSASAQVAVPNPPTKPLFQGRQGEQRSSEVHFDPTTRTVTMKLSVQDLNGYFVPNLHRNNFAVFEDGVQQRNVTVEVEHAPITLAVLLEMGGRSQRLNKTLATEGAYLVRP